MKKFILGCMVASLLSACSITNEDIISATELCKNNEGIDYMTVNSTTIVVKCVNGATFYK